jgi:hypothetical protein
VLGCKVALKVLRADVRADLRADVAAGAGERSLSDLLAEARANAAVVHPPVVTVDPVGRINLVPWDSRSILCPRGRHAASTTRRSRSLASAGPGGFPCGLARAAPVVTVHDQGSPG